MNIGIEELMDRASFLTDAIYFFNALTISMKAALIAPSTISAIINIGIVELIDRTSFCLMST
jgi:hypothetical protein